MPDPVTDAVVIGASGLLGQHLMNEAGSRGLDVVGTCATEAARDLVRLDLSDPSVVHRFMARERPKNVLLSAAMTSVDVCESRPDLAEAINASAPGLVAQECATLRAGLVYFSTDYVFGDRVAPADEETPMDPMNVYGRTKADGETNVRAQHPSPIVVRTCANFGWNRLRMQENSVTWIINRLRHREPVPLFEDQRVSPSYAPDVARVAFDLLDRDGSGVFHVASRDCISRVEMGQAVSAVFQLPESLLRSVKLADARLPARRPRNSCLATAKVERTLNIRMRGFRECLVDMRGLE